MPKESTKKTSSSIPSEIKKPKSRRGRPPKIAQTSNIVTSTPLINVLEFKQTYLQLLDQEKEFIKTKQPPSFNEDLLLMSDEEDEEETLNTSSTQEPILLMEDEESFSNLESLEDVHMIRHHHNHHNRSFSNSNNNKKQTLSKLLESNDLRVRKPEQVIEDAIKEELERTKDAELSIEMEVPSDVHKVLKLSNIPTLSNLIEHSTPKEETIQCISEEAKVENMSVLPKRIENFLSPTVESNFYGKFAREKVQACEKGEVILQVAIYHPIRNAKVQEFLVLGSQSLTDLRDCIYCLNDYIPGGQSIRSGYFFIENVFYNDMRLETNIEYSKEIIQWLDSYERVLANTEGIVDQSSTLNLLASASNTTTGFPLLASGANNTGNSSTASGDNNNTTMTNNNKYLTRKMEDYTFYDLSLRLNEPYIYCHQGNCMHYIVFTDMRLICEERDQMNIYAYPIRIFQAKPKRRKCGICEIYQAKWVTYNDKHIPEDPSFFCDSCYRQFHYGHDGQLLYGDFEVYRYFHE
ncbi:hypothetical protein ABK040_005636 [Willaertia magna]